MRGIVVATGDQQPDAEPAALWTVGGKPLLGHALSALAAAGIRRILIAAPAASAAQIQAHFGHRGGGEQAGAQLSYLIGPESLGLAQALHLGGEFVGRRAVALAAADRVIFGNGLDAQLKDAAAIKQGACVFVCAADSAPEPPPGLATGQQHAGLFFYDKSAPARMTALMRESPAAAIADLHRAYQNTGKLRVQQLAPTVKIMRVTCAESRAAAERAIAAERRENSP